MPLGNPEMLKEGRFYNMNSNILPGAVIVAAGLSSRMGAFKPLLPIDGIPLLETGIRTLQEGGVETIFVVTGYRADLLRPILARTGAKEVFNPVYAQADMFDSVCIGLAEAMAAHTRLFFLPGDIALFQPHTIRAMTQWQGAAREGLLQPCYEGKPGHPVLLSGALPLHILEHNGTGGPRGALACWRGAQERIDLPDPGILLDADTQDDYNRLLAYRASCAR